jgi:transcriptional regulator with XRE-family HTH domain
MSPLAKRGHGFYTVSMVQPNERYVARALPLPHLRQARESRGISARELSRRTGVARATLTHLENRNRKAYRSTILKLAEVLGTEPWTLVSNVWEMNEIERKAFARLMESGRPQTFIVNEEEEDHTNG